MAKKTKIKAYVAFGEYAASRASDHEWESLIENNKGDLGVREFKTQAEKRAYLLGMADVLGWEDYYCLDGREVKQLAKHIDLDTITAATDY